MKLFVGKPLAVTIRKEQWACFFFTGGCFFLAGVKYAIAFAFVAAESTELKNGVPHNQVPLLPCHAMVAASLGSIASLALGLLYWLRLQSYADVPKCVTEQDDAASAISSASRGPSHHQVSTP